MPPPVTIDETIAGVRAVLGRVLRIAAIAMLGLVPAPGWTAGSKSPPAPDTPLDGELFPLGRTHFRRCWQLEHDYYALRDEIGHTALVWRRQELEQRWGKGRERR